MTEVPPHLIASGRVLGDRFVSGLWRYAGAAEWRARCLAKMMREGGGGRCLPLFMSVVPPPSKVF